MNTVKIQRCVLLQQHMPKLGLEVIFMGSVKSHQSSGGELPPEQSQGLFPNQLYGHYASRFSVMLPYVSFKFFPHSSFLATFFLNWSEGRRPGALTSCNSKHISELKYLTEWIYFNHRIYESRFSNRNLHCIKSVYSYNWSILYEVMNEDMDVISIFTTSSALLEHPVSSHKAFLFIHSCHQHQNFWTIL